MKTKFEFPSRLRWRLRVARAHTRLGLATGAVVFASHGLSAQVNSISIAAGNAPATIVAPGAVFSVPVVIDMTAAGTLNLASFSAGITWGAGRITLDSIKAGAFGTLTSNFASGSAALGVFNATGTTTNASVANLFFTAGPATGGTQVVLSSSAAGNDVGVDLLPAVTSRPLNVCVAPIGFWGDANDDGTVNIIDAQQLARFSVGLSVANVLVLNLQGDVTADGTVNIIDAQQIARFAVSLSAAVRVGTIKPQVPAVASVVITPPSPSIAIGSTALLTATPLDATSTDLTGCATVTWSTSDATKATVNANGLVTVLAAGSVSITASTSGRSASMALSTFVPIATVVTAPDTTTVPMGTQVQVTPTARDASSNVLVGRTFTFASSDTNVATVSASGLVTTKTVGFVTITTSSGGKNGVTTIQSAPLAKNALATGDTHSCALTVTGSAFCWGLNGSGQLGDGTTTQRTSPVQVAAPQGVVFTQISAAGASTCGLSSQKEIYCWGAVFGAQFANVIPALLSNTLKATSISVGSGFGCALDTFNAVWCWGSNASGKLGTGDTLSSVVPRPVAGGLVFQSIGASVLHACGLSSGAVFCWGSNSQGTLGLGSNSGPTSSALVPTVVVGGLTFTSLFVGGLANCGIQSGTAFCWGNNQFGNIGNGSAPGALVHSPTQVVGATAFGSIAPSIGNNIFDPTCGLSTSGAAFCWGLNQFGELGTSATLPSTCTSGTQSIPCTGVPTAVTTSVTFVVLSGGSQQNCGLTTTHTILCWGRNANGQLGNGNTINQATPTLVAGALRFP